ncbi:KH domain-containing protein [Candidatus Saccharibacteria bacterium]|nr:KH domain-containing protein [Candidatus Saccharibacteria bacterium]
MIDQEFVKYIVSSLVSKPDKVRVDRIMDERGVLLTLHVDEEDLGRVIGRKGSTAQSLRVLLRALGSKNEAHYNLRIADNRERPASSERPADGGEQAPAEAEVAEEGGGPGVDEDAFAAGASDFARDEESAEAVKEDDDSLADKTKRELDDLNDLDI